MGIDIRLPQITGATEKEQLAQIKSYLYQFAEQLQWGLQNVNTSNNSVFVQEIAKSLYPSNGSGSVDPNQAAATFAAIKSLIIKSADIVDAYYDEISRKLVGEYAALSEFGTFQQTTLQTIEETSRNTTQSFKNVQVIIDQQGVILRGEINSAENDLKGSLNSVEAEVKASIDAVEVNTKEYADGISKGLSSSVDAANKRLDEVEQKAEDTTNSLTNSIQAVEGKVKTTDQLLADAKSQLQGGIDNIKVEILGRITEIDTSAYIRTGELYETSSGVPVIGMEIGQTVKVNGGEEFNKFARITSEKLSFFDKSGYEVAHIGDKHLYIKQAEIPKSLQIGSIISLVMENGDVVKKRAIIKETEVNI
jgi:hypothetical protein